MNNTDVKMLKMIRTLDLSTFSAEQLETLHRYMGKLKTLKSDYTFDISGDTDRDGGIIPSGVTEIDSSALDIHEGKFR